MIQSPYYTTKQAADLTGASRQIIRVYTTTYARYFSSEGSPAEPGAPRRFTADDLRLIRFIYERTAEQRQSHQTVLAALAAGALEQFAWQAPEPPQSAAQADLGHEPTSTALVPLERLQAAQALLAEAQRREAEAIQLAQRKEAEAQQQVQALTDRLLSTERELGSVQGELKALKAMHRKPSWWVRLFGGSAE